MAEASFDTTIHVLPVGLVYTLPITQNFCDMWNRLGSGAGV